MHLVSRCHVSASLLAALLLGLLLLFPASSTVRAATHTQYVFSAADRTISGTTDCTQPLTGCALRDALHAAAPGDIVALAPSITSPITVSLTENDLVIAQDVTIHGGGLLTVDGGDNSRVFAITGGTVVIDGVTIKNGNARNSATNSYYGGGIYHAAGALTVTSSTLAGNSATYGGGIATFGGTVTVTNSTLTGNRAVNGGGGIYITNTTMTVTNSTLTGNSGIGGGIFVDTGSSAIVQATLFGALGATNCEGSVVSHDYNLASDTSCMGLTAAHDHTGVSPNLDPAGLQPNGSTGPMTVALLPNSPAIEAGGACPAGVTTDERGQPRVGTCDIGAYEYQPVTPTLMDATGSVTGGPVIFHGTGFQTGSRLTLGSPFSATLDAPAIGVSADGTSMTLDIPAGMTAGPVSGGMTVANPGIPPSARATFTYLPVITSLTPASGVTTGGGSVTITGAGFVAGNTSVRFGTIPMTVTNVTPMMVTVTAPAHVVGTVDVTMTVNGVSTTKAGAYTYGTVNALPQPQPAGAANGPPTTLPGARPVGPSSPSGSPNPLPMGR